MSCLPSTASLIREIVLSILRRRVLGLVIVVPRLACRPCPLRNGVDILDIEVVGDIDNDGDIGDCIAAVPSDTAGTVEPLVIAASMAAFIPFGEGTGFGSSLGVAGLER